MIGGRAPSRTVIASIVFCTVLLSSACVPAPTPTPTPTGFTSAEQAFAAAEQTYRDHIEALNQVDLADPATFEAPLRYLTGDAEADSRKSFSQMHADGWTVAGDSRLVSMTPISAVLSPLTVVMVACTDVSAIELTDSTGGSVVDADRPDVQTTQLTFRPASKNSLKLLVSESGPYDGQSPCT